MDFNQKEALLKKRENANKLNCALADFISILSAITCQPVRASCDRVYCYCNIRAKDALFGAFCAIDEKAYLLSELIDRDAFQDLNMAVIGQLSHIRKQYAELDPANAPAELFLDFDSVSLEAHGLLSYDDVATDPYDATLRYSAWLKEHGGEPKPLPPRDKSLGSIIKFKMGKTVQEEVHNPTADCVELDIQALRDSQLYANGEIADPMLKLAPETGWDAVRKEYGRAYPGCDTEPMSFESDDGKTWVDIYDGGENWNYISAGLASMGAEPEDGSLGAEYCISLKKMADQDEDDMQIFRMLNMLRHAMAKALEEKALLEEYAYLALEDGGFIALAETKLSSIEAPSGSIGFRRLVYVSAAKLQELESGSMDVKSLCAKLGTDVSKF